jgi:hypothetical protein
VGVLLVLVSAAAVADGDVTPEQAVEYGRKMYMEGVLPSGEPLTALVSGDVEITGEFVVCGECHRKSGLGASEGESVAPPVVGSLLYQPLQLPVSRPPEPPVQRPAYDRESLAASIRDGLSSTGEEFSMLMPRYPLSDQNMGYLIAYLESLTVGPDPGVTETDIHFATVITDDVAPEARKALLDVMNTFIGQKNTETRYESKRASSGPWHKDWVFKNYRKWVMHTWELEGPPSGWRAQLEEQYVAQPVFAVLNGVSNRSWEPVHAFCEDERLPCIFPTTDLPVVDQEDFYNVYLSRGIFMEADTIAGNLAEIAGSAGRVVQVYKAGDERSEAAANALSARLGDDVTTVEFGDLDAPVADTAVVVAWLDANDSNSAWQTLEGQGLERLYLSGAILDGGEGRLEESMREYAWIAYSTELPGNTARLLARSTGWFRIRRIYSSEYEEIQANAYFTMKITGAALGAIRLYFNRDFFLESIEHMIDNATYTSVYPRMSLAPEQRFASKGSLLARFDTDNPGKLVAVTEWAVPE